MARKIARLIGLALLAWAALAHAEHDRFDANTPRTPWGQATAVAETTLLFQSSLTFER